MKPISAIEIIITAVCGAALAVLLMASIVATPSAHDDPPNIVYRGR